MSRCDFLKSHVDRRLRVTEMLLCPPRQRVPDTESSNRESPGRGWLATDESPTGGTSRRLVPAERNVRQPPGRSTTGMSGPKYRGGTVP